MRYRWDPAYPMGRRDTQAYDASLRASDDERNAVADKLSRHYAEGRLDEVEFKNRLDIAMSATTRGDLNGLFGDLPPPAQRSGATGAATPSHPPLGSRRRPGRHRGGCHHALLPALPRAVVPLRRRRLLPVAAGRRPPCPRAPPPRTPPPRTPPRRGGAELGHGPLSRRHGHPHRRPRAPGAGRRPRVAAFPDTLRRPFVLGAARNRSPLRRLHRPPRAGDTGPGRACPDVAPHHGWSRHRPARRQADRAARAGRLLVGALAPPRTAVLRRGGGAFPPSRC